MSGKSMYNYTISIIEYNNKKIQRLEYYNEEQAMKVYKVLYVVVRYYTNDIYGILLWQHAKSKTIDNDPHAKIIEQYYNNNKRQKR